LWQKGKRKGALLRVRAGRVAGEDVGEVGEDEGDRREGLRGEGEMKRKRRRVRVSAGKDDSDEEPVMRGFSLIFLFVV
jgi:hypothetical protein